MSEMTNEKKESRRELLKKVGKFVVPTIVTFQISSLVVAASGKVDPFRASGDPIPIKK